MSNTRNPFKLMTRAYLEAKIKKALLGQNLDEIILWLNIASGSEDSTKPSALLPKFGFDDKKPLLTYAIDESNRLLNLYLDYRKNATWYQRLWNFIRFTTPEKRYLHPAQTIVKNIFLLENKMSQPLPKAKVWQRLVGWWTKALKLVLNFNTVPLTLSGSMEAFHENGILKVEGSITPARVKGSNAPTKSILDQSSLSEHHTPSELLSKPDLIAKRLTKAEKKYKKPEPNPDSTHLPTDLSPWLSETRLTTVVALDQLQQQIQLQQQDQRLDLGDMRQLAPVQMQVKQYVDNTIAGELAAVTRNYNSAFEWIKNYVAELSKIHLGQRHNRLDSYSSNLKISEKAKEILISGNNYFPFSYQEDIDLDKLPLGFFIDIEKSYKDGTSYILKFSEELREEQLKDPIARLRLDPAYITALENRPHRQAAQPDEENQETLERWQHKLDTELKSQRIDLQFEPLQTLFEFAKHKAPSDVKSSDGRGVDRYQSLLPSLYKQLYSILHIAGREHFLSLVIQLAKLKGVESKQHDRWSMAYTYGAEVKSCTLLDNFLGAFFPEKSAIAEIVGEELCSGEALKKLADLCKDENAVAQKLFAALINTESSALFNKAYHVAMTAQQHFKALKIRVTDDFLKTIASDGIKAVEELINLSSASALPKLQIELELAGEAYSNLVFCERLLQQGYSFVADCMDVGRYSATIKGEIDSGSRWNADWRNVVVPMIVRDLNNFYLGSSGNQEPPPGQSGRQYMYIRNPYFIAWFRYLAIQVDLRYVEKAIEEWRKYMGKDSLVIRIENYERDKRNLEKYWGKLVAYILALPKKLDAPYISEVKMGDAVNKEHSGLVNEGLKNEGHLSRMHSYDLDSANELCLKLKLSKEETNSILNKLESLNTLADAYKIKPSAALLEDAKELRHSKDPQQLIKALGALRELNYRLTTANSKAQPPKGEWLRMEQALVILLSLSEPAKLFQVETSEGKTLIIGLTAMLHALNGKKTDILTHTESFAKEAFDKIHYLSQLLGLKLADSKSNPNDKLAADIYCGDISSTVISATLAAYERHPLREAEIALGDEIDNQIDIQAKTTMQISAAKSIMDPKDQQDFEEFLLALSASIDSLKLKDKKDLPNKEDQLKFIKDDLLKRIKSFPESALPFWIPAMVQAQQMQPGKDYIVEGKYIRIVHHTTTGHVDRQSIWGQGVHQCVAAREKAHNQEVCIEPMSQIIAEGNIASYYENSKYKTRYGYTGTLGNPDFSKEIAKVMKADITITMPRAMRADLEEANWPLVANGKVGYNKKYNRAYRFAPIVVENNEEHIKTLLAIVDKVRGEGQSLILFFNTIKECQDFATQLPSNNLVQIFDGTCQREDNASGIKFSQKAAISRAAQAGMVTLTTAAGSRGADFNSVTVGVLAKPGLSRVNDQKAGRIGRNEDFGLVYEVYSYEDLDDSAQKELITLKDEITAKAHTCERAKLRLGLDKMEENLQKSDLEQLKQRKATDAFKDRVQKEYRESGSRSDRRWATFFASINPTTLTESENAWTELKQTLRSP